MKKIKLLALFAFLFLFLPHSAKAQVPSFDCSKSIQVYTDVTTGNVYSCKITAGVGTWMLAGGGGGAFGPNFVAGGGTAQAQTVAPTTAVTNATLVNGYQQCWLPIAANTGAAPTLAGSGTSTFSAKPITKYGTVALVANDITTVGIACAIYDGTEFQLQNPQTGKLAALPTTPNGVSFIDTSTPAGGIAVAPVWSWPGVTVTAQTGTTYTFLAADRNTCVTASNVAAQTYTLPDVGGTNFQFGYNSCLINNLATGTTVTLQNTSASTINGGTTFAVPYLDAAYIYSDPANNWRVVLVGPVANGATAGFVDFPQGATSAAVYPCNTANSWCVQASAAMTAGVETMLGVHAQGINAGTGSSSAIQDVNSGDAGHSAVVTIGSGADIAATSLCSTANCPVGTYAVSIYIDMSTPCGTTGTFIAWLGYTDDSGARTGSSTTTFFDIQGTGSVPSTGTLTTTSTANFGQATYILRTTGAATGGLGSINYGATRTACGTAGPMVGKMYLNVVPLG